MTSGQIKSALSQYCADYRYLDIEEASTPGHRFDFWWMKPSFREQAPCGVEIKVSRADFKADKKWREYLPYCEKFYFACPVGLIKPEELEKEVGLIWVHEDGTVAFEKRAKRRLMSEKAMKKMLLRVIFKLHWGDPAPAAAHQTQEGK